jgi:hypothetical protein
MVVNYFDFGRYHGKDGKQGSTLIRMQQMERYWSDFTPYKYGANPEAIIFQKVYCTEDYKFPKTFEGIKLLDICDPDWLDGINIVETARAMDAVVTPTEPMAEFIRQFQPNTHVIPDRFDLAMIPSPVKHTARAKTVVWFGYSHNATLMKQAMKILDELDLDLIIISNDDPLLHQYSHRARDYYTFVKYNEATVYQEMLKADIALLPEGFRPVDAFKSNNKAIKANLLGLPVAKTADELRMYMLPGARQLWYDENYSIIREEYDIQKSVAEYKALIDGIRK